mmetsp:Transcript_43768/g.70037  ORF Transcript_43768/g.70037 Transcript_43768/m.70037 type:complete len:744 (-) Transcript_43768:99-2330(-)
MAVSALRYVVVVVFLQAALASRFKRKQMMHGLMQQATEQDNSTAEGDGCSSVLVIKYDTSATFAMPGPIVRGSWSFSSWPDVELFKKLESDCAKTYRAQCEKDGVVVQSDCGEEEVRCIGNPPGCWNSFRQTTLHSGESLILKVPTTTGGTCDFKMTSGYIKYQVSTLFSLAPSAEDLAVVAAFAAAMSGSNDECGEAAMAIRQDADAAADQLAELAVARRNSADEAGKAEVQIVNGLFALHFRARRKRFFTADVTSHAKIRTLAEDIKLILLEGNNPFEVIHSMTTAKNLHGMQALGYYFNSAIEHRHQKGGRRALIFTCSFGGGHKSAAKSVSDALKTAGFETVIMDTTYDDHFENRGNKLAAEFFNEFVLKRQNYLLFNVMDKMQQLMGPLTKPCPSPKCDSDRKQQFRTAVLKHRPDLIVTVYHMELLSTLEIAKELGNLPVLHVATDMDIKMKELFNSKLVPVYPKFLAGVPFDLQESYDTIAPLTREQTFLSGYPVRSAFLKTLDEDRVAEVAAEKAAFVPEGTKILLIMTGGGGQDVPWPYKLAERGIGIPLHIVIIAGGNNELAGKLQSKLCGERSVKDCTRSFGDREVWSGSDDSVTVEVATDEDNKNEEKPYYVLEKRLAMLLDMADLVMSKPGGGSTAEIAYRGVPAIFDTSVTLFHWELFTVEVFEKADRGLRFSSENELRDVIPKAIAMERSQKLAEDNGQLLDTSARVVDAAERLLTMECAGCPVFAES